MKSKKTIIITVIVILGLLLSGGLFLIFTKEDKDTTLSLVDKRWIENNKNKVFDVALVNNIPVFNYKGNGVFFEFLTAIETDTKLDFNPIAYNYGSDHSSEYAFRITKEKPDNSLLLYEDNYVLVGNSKNKYNNLNSIVDVKIGVFENEMDLVSKYLNTSVSFQKYKTIDELIAAILPEEDAKPSVDLIAIPKMVYLDKIIENDGLNILYNISDLKEYYTLMLGNNEKLNSIITKYFAKWYKDDYDEVYKKYLNDNYFSFKNIDDTEKAKLKSKDYLYGFIDNAPYDLLNKDKLLGINSNIIKDFSELADVELEIKQYRDVFHLLEAFNKNELDFIFDNYSRTEYKMDVFHSTSFYDEKVVVISNIKNNITVNSLNSLTDKEVLTVADTKIEQLLSENGNKVKKAHNLNDLLQTIKEEDIAVIDYPSFYYYSKTKLNDFKIDYEFVLKDDYGYTMRDISDNKLFNDYFNFYLSFINEKEVVNTAYIKLFSVKTENKVDRLMVYLLSLVIMLLLFIIVLKKIIFKKKKKKHNNMSKADKLKYIDVLTSLKNRNYLNDHIEIWDDNEVYPQTVVIIDLNNIAYINDNYGHQEGDTVIKDAANILIKNQLENTEIIRTNGNEFLIYMIGYEEKQVVSYLRKINKEFKDLAHGFGAASGYSMITDAIKTIDDAVNEATLDMRNNKEELNN